MSQAFNLKVEIDYDCEGEKHFLFKRIDVF